MKTYKVAICIINYNSSEHTKKCIDSILQQTPLDIDFKIVVIDNASDYNDFLKLKDVEKNDRVILRRNQLNKGFSGGHMTAVGACNALYYLFQNNDSYFLNDYLSPLLRFAGKNPDFGVLGGCMLDKDSNYSVSFHHHPTVANKVIGKRLISLLSRKKYHRPKSSQDHPIPVDVINGSSMFVKAASFNEVGGLDTTYFLYCEEEDLALRMNRAGYTNWLIPDAKYLHLSGQSTPDRWIFKREFYISFMYYYRKNYSFVSYKFMQVFQFFKLFKRAFRNAENLKMAMFIAKGAPLSDSLKHSQVPTQNV